MTQKRLEELFQLTPKAQIRHWGKPDPWEGMRLGNKTVITQNQVRIDGDLNIVQMPLLAARPCFAQPTAFARHGGHQPIPSPRFGSVKSRCMRCRAQEACEHVAKKRLRHTPEIKSAFIRFGNAGGAFGLRNPKDCPTAQREFDGLVSALMRNGGFTNDNDRAAREFYREFAERKRVEDAADERAKRRKGIISGAFYGEFENLLERQRFWRQVQLKGVIDLPEPPNFLRRLKENSAKITADVWLELTVMKIRKEKPNPSLVARRMMDRSPQAYANHNSLRQRIPADMKRCKRLENTILESRIDPIWPPFDLDDALDELDALIPYNS